MSIRIIVNRYICNSACCANWILGIGLLNVLSQYVFYLLQCATFIELERPLPSSLNLVDVCKQVLKLVLVKQPCLKNIRKNDSR